MTATQFVEELRQFFTAIERPLCDTLDAARCREGWLQGEMFRWFRRRAGFQDFQVNSLSIAPRCTADFHVEQPLRLVGEMKILGAGYMNKCITGGSIHPLLARVDRPVAESDRNLILGPWGLIPDFFRLLDFAVGDRRNALLVLIADGVIDSQTQMAQALRQINFISESVDVKTSRTLIRIWTVHEEPAAADRTSNDRHR